jgi:hypothetical protein
MAGAGAEKKLADLGLTVELGSQISSASPFTLWLFGKKVHSHHKMDGFYCLLGVAIVGLAVTLGLAVKPAATLPNTPTAARQTQIFDDDAAKAVCEAHVQDLFARAGGVPGSVVIDPSTGRQAVLVAGRWRLVPKC